jgi:hypothetical protein
VPSQLSNLNQSNMTKQKANKAAKGCTRSKPSSLSAASIGQALVILAGSCAAFSGSGSSSSASSSSCPSHYIMCDAIQSPRGVGEQRSTSITALRYRDLDDDHSVDVRAIHDDASQVSSTITQTARRGTTSTTASSWLSIPSILPQKRQAPSNSQDEQQVVMDEYLEYVERRYSRMRMHSRKPKVELTVRRLFMLTRTVLLAFVALKFFV